MSKVPFYKIAQELGIPPMKLRQRLAESGIAIASTSSMLDPEIVRKIRAVLDGTPLEEPVAVPAAPPAPVPSVEAEEPKPLPPATKKVKRATGQVRVQPVKPAAPPPPPKAPSAPIIPPVGKPAKEFTTDAYISYRREGGAEAARTLYRALNARGFTAFFDASLGPSRYDARIAETIEEARNYLVLLDPGCADAIMDEESWLYREVKTAIKAGCKLIAVLKDGFRFPPLRELPPAMVMLARQPQIKYDLDRYEAMIDRIVLFIKQ